MGSESLHAQAPHAFPLLSLLTCRRARKSHLGKLPFPHHLSSSERRQRPRAGISRQTVLHAQSPFWLLNAGPSNGLAVLQSQVCSARNLPLSPRLFAVRDCPSRVPHLRRSQTATRI